MSADNFMNAITPDGCEVWVEVKDNHLILIMVNCINNDNDKLNYLLNSVLYKCVDKGFDKVMVILNMCIDLRILDLTYLLSGRKYAINSKVAFIYNKLAEYINGDLIGIMKGENNCNLFSNIEDAEKWLFNETTKQST